jgi:hypothetical protein
LRRNVGFLIDAGTVGLGFFIKVVEGFGRVLQMVVNAIEVDSWIRITLHTGSTACFGYCGPWLRIFLPRSCGTSFGGARQSGKHSYYDGCASNHSENDAYHRTSSLLFHGTFLLRIPRVRLDQARLSRFLIQTATADKLFIT